MTCCSPAAPSNGLLLPLPLPLFQQWPLVRSLPPLLQLPPLPQPSRLAVAEATHIQPCDKRCFAISPQAVAATTVVATAATANPALEEGAAAAPVV